MINPVVSEITDYIKQQIMTETYHAGDRISERTISDSFGVSRTIVREALFELKRTGWLYAESKSGTYVTKLDQEQMRQNYMARRSLEPQILLMAFPNLTADDIAAMKENCRLMLAAETKAAYAVHEHEQHRILYTRANNVYISSFMEQMMDIMLRIAAKGGVDAERRAACVKEWEDVIAALEARELHTAMLRFANHIQISCDNYFKVCHIEENEKAE